MDSSVKKTIALMKDVEAASLVMEEFDRQVKENHRCVKQLTVLEQRRNALVKQAHDMCLKHHHKTSDQHEVIGWAKDIIDVTAQVEDAKRELDLVNEKLDRGKREDASMRLSYAVDALTFHLSVTDNAITYAKYICETLTVRDNKTI